MIEISDSQRTTYNWIKISTNHELLPDHSRNDWDFPLHMFSTSAGLWNGTIKVNLIQASFGTPPVFQANRQSATAE